MNKNEALNQFTEKTLFNKLSGRSDFTFSEVKRIRDIVSPGQSLDELFKKTEIKKG